MKKNKLILVALFSLVGFVQKVNAQATIFALLFGDKVATENFNISLELGANFAQFSNLSNTKQNQVGINFGTAGNIMLSNNWYLTPAVYFVSKRSLKLTSFSLNTGNPNLDQEFMDKKATMFFNYIDIPILFAYQTNNKKFRFGMGPQVSFLTSSRIEVFGDDGSFTQDYKSETNSHDYGLLSSVGYLLGKARKGKGIHLQMRYYQGFTDVLKDSFSANTNRGSYLSFHISLPFITDELAEKNIGK